MKNLASIVLLFAGISLFIYLGSEYTITAQTTPESEIPADVQERLDKTMNRFSQVAKLSEEQRGQIEPIMLDMLLQARVIVQDTTTPLETRQEQMTALLETTRLQIEPLLSESQQGGFGMVWSRVSEQVMKRLE